MLGTMLESLWAALTWPTILLLIASYLIYVWYKSGCRPAGFPPGPRPLPLVGNILMFKGPLYEFYNNIAKEYGNVFAIKIATTWCVVLNDIDAAKEAYLKKPLEFAGRPNSYSIDMFTMGLKDIAFSPVTETWKLHRKIAHAAIRHFASGKELEKLIYSVTPKVAQVIGAKEGQSFEPKDVLGLAVYNVLAKLCFGHEYSFDDPKLQMWINFNKSFMKEIGLGLPADYIPILKYFPKDAKTKRVTKLCHDWFEAIGVELKEHRETYNPENIRDLIDSLMKAQQDARDEGSEKVDSLTDEHLLQTVADIFQAGTDTTTASLHWFVALMAKHPDIQQKVAEEIDRVVGRDRYATFADRSRLPYTEATLYEMLRFSSISALGLTHTTTEDTSVGGYRIPKDTWVVVNHWAIHYDEKNWDEPHEFKPERFLDETGEVRQHPNAFLPFSFGRRVCLGETFAKAEMFLLFAWLFQRYTFSKPPEQEEDFDYKLKPTTGMVHQPDDYQIVAVKRFEFGDYLNVI